MIVNVVKLCCRLFPYREIGWKEINETFYRWTIVKTKWFSIYLHYLDAKQWHEKCHDHPWWFLALIIWGGYWEMTKEGTAWRPAGSLLFRKAEHSHNVMTPTENWSLILVGPRSRKWGFQDCREQNGRDHL